MILASGCSWTDPNFQSNFHPEMDCSWPKWYDHINTNKRVVSVGFSGYSNQTIIDKALEQIYTNPDITTVVCGLTEWSRFHLHGTEIHPALWVRDAELRRKPHKERSERDVASIEAASNFVSYINSLVSLENIGNWNLISNIVNATILKLKTLQEVCEGSGIKLVVFELVHTIPHPFIEIATGEIIKNKIFQEMYQKPSDTFLGFPFFQELGGTNVEHLLMRPREDYYDFVVSKIDLHPNAAGHKLIGDWLNEQVDLH
jgi:hypothetical protein